MSENEEIGGVPRSVNLEDMFFSETEKEKQSTRRGEFKRELERLQTKKLSHLNIVKEFSGPIKDNARTINNFLNEIDDDMRAKKGDLEELKIIVRREGYATKNNPYYDISKLQEDIIKKLFLSLVWRDEIIDEFLVGLEKLEEMIMQVADSQFSVKEIEAKSERDKENLSFVKDMFQQQQKFFMDLSFKLAQRHDGAASLPQKAILNPEREIYAEKLEEEPLPELPKVPKAKKVKKEIKPIIENPAEEEIVVK